MEEQEQKISKYNSGVAIQIRLDLVWKDANDHSRKGDFTKWNNDLDVVWRELARDISTKDWDIKKKELEKFDTDISNIGNAAVEPPKGFQKIDPKVWKKRDELYKLLVEKELFLKRLENELGKGTKFGDDEDFDFE